MQKNVIKEICILDSLIRWSETCLLWFNSDEYKLMHMKSTQNFLHHETRIKKLAKELPKNKI